jgi:hypothetical protein
VHLKAAIRIQKYPSSELRMLSYWLAILFLEKPMVNINVVERPLDQCEMVVVLGEYDVPLPRLYSRAFQV